MNRIRETTDLTLFVRTSDYESTPWNRQRIVDALLRETGIDYATAEAVSKEVEKQIIASGITRLTTTLVRELVDARLVERGLERERRLHAALGFPLFDVRQLLLHENRENANIPHGPEGTNLVLAEGIKREYALHDVFGTRIGDAHIAGDIHLHGLGYVDRPLNATVSLEYIKRFGLDLPHAATVAAPARHAEVLLAHMVRFSAVLQGLFSGLISWEMVNVSFAPYLGGQTVREVEQFAQMLIYEFSQLTSARGGQSLLVDMHLYWQIPPRIAQMPAVGPKGEATGKCYGDYEKEARMLAGAIYTVLSAGDARGRPFISPQPIVHITAGMISERENDDFLNLVCRVAQEKGNGCFFFDRNAQADELTYTDRQDGENALGAVGIMGATVHNVTLNLPRLSLRAQGDEKRLFSLLEEQLSLAVSAHQQKKTFLERLLSFGERGPLAALTMRKALRPYFELDQANYWVGLVGLNEAVQIQCGQGLIDEKKGLPLGLKIVSHLAENLSFWQSATGLKLALVQSEAETTAYRFARLDLKYFSPQAGRYVQGDLSTGGMYYSNSTHLSVATPLDFFSRVDREARFHPWFTGGARSLLHLGEESFAASDVVAFIRRVFRETKSQSLVFSPEFTICLPCGRTSRGRRQTCQACGSLEVDGMARITHYFSRTSGWNRGKLAELANRYLASALFPPAPIQTLSLPVNPGGKKGSRKKR